MTTTEEFVAWLGQSRPASPTHSPPAPVPPADPPAQRDRVAEYLAKQRAASTAKFNPLFPARAATDQPPAKTGNLVTDYVARMTSAAARRPNPLRRP